MFRGSKFCITVFVIVYLLGCNTSFKSETAFLEWLGNPKNGFVKRTQANGFSMTMKYLPAEYLAFTEFKNEEPKSNEESASLLQEFDESITFLFSIEHEVSGVDISNYGVRNIPEFKRRISELNFNIKDYIFLKHKDGKKSKPVLTTFENSYEIGGKKTFYLVFSREQELQEIEELDIVFEDAFFDTGINHFMFDTKQINNIPTLQFIN